MMKNFLVTFFMVLVLPAIHAQIPTSPCTNSMISSFTPCVNYLTNSSGNGSSPTTECCNSLRSLMSNGTDCLCQIVTGGVPFRFPINRTMAISLPRACNQPGVPIQCKASPGAPIPAPGPAAFGSPSPSPATSMSPTPSSVGTAPTTETPAISPASDANPALTPPSTTEGGLSPTSIGSTPGTSSSVTPSTATPSLSIAPTFLLLSVAIMIMKHI
ncbi:Lipid transfer-like protein VAS [Bienertia sinuspersici]